MFASAHTCKFVHSSDELVLLSLAEILHKGRERMPWFKAHAPALSPTAMQPPDTMIRMLVCTYQTTRMRKLRLPHTSEAPSVFPATQSMACEGARVIA